MVDEIAPKIEAILWNAPMEIDWEVNRAQAQVGLTAIWRAFRHCRTSGAVMPNHWGGIVKKAAVGLGQAGSAGGPAGEEAHGEDAAAGPKKPGAAAASGAVGANSSRGILAGSGVPKKTSPAGPPAKGGGDPRPGAIARGKARVAAGEQEKEIESRQPFVERNKEACHALEAQLKRTKHEVRAAKAKHEGAQKAFHQERAKLRKMQEAQLELQTELKRFEGISKGLGPGRSKSEVRIAKVRRVWSLGPW